MFQRLAEYIRTFRERGEKPFEAGLRTADADGCPQLAESTASSRALGTKPIFPLFMRYAAISLVGVIAQIAMVVSEGIVVGNGIGSVGLACMSVVMTFEIVNMALGSSLGQGVSAVCGNLLGAGDEAGACRAFGQGFWFTFLLACAVSAIFCINTPAIVPLIGATPEIEADCIAAVRIFMVGYPFCITGQMICQMLRQDERPGLASAIQTLGSVVAATWLVVSVFVLKLGVAGAAAYYAISTALWFLGILGFVLPRRDGTRSVFSVRLSDIRVSPRLVYEVCRYGCPVFLVQISSAIYVAVMNHTLGATGDTGNVASFAIINSYFMYTLNIVCMALAYALQPIAAYNEGAGNDRRLADLLVVAAGVEIVCIGIISCVTNAFAPQMCLLFTGGDAELAASSAGHVKIVLMFCAFGFLGQIMSAYFESIGGTKRAVMFGVLRYAVFAVPAILVISACSGIENVWWALPAADLATFALSVVMAGAERRRLLACAASGVRRASSFRLVL